MSKEKSTTEIERRYSTPITYKCPRRGWVTEEVMVTRYKAQQAPEDVPVDSDVAELLKTTTGEDLDELGFQEEN